MNIQGGSINGNFLTSGKPMETIWSTIESSGTRWISGVENFSRALKSASEKNLKHTPIKEAFGYIYENDFFENLWIMKKR